MSSWLEGKHVAITGASSGIGAALARELGRSGARLTLVARRRELLVTLASEIGAGCAVVSHDLSQPAQVLDWIAPAEAAAGAPIDVLVNNAGIENTGPVSSSDVEGATRLLHTNLHAPLLMTRHLLPAMLARKSGLIVQIASVAALAPPPRQAWYGASKAGLAAFSEALRGELRGSGVGVVTVYPGPVRTAMAEAGYAAYGGRKGLVKILPEGTPEVLAVRIRRAIERRSARVIYPRFYTIARLFPWLVRWLVDSAKLPPAAE